MANIRPSLQFYGMIIFVKTKPLCRGMAWLPFQKHLNTAKSYRYDNNFCSS